MDLMATPMAERQLSFDFNKAVADARRDFPKETADVTFVALDAPDAEAEMDNFLKSLSESDQKEAAELRASNPDLFTTRQGARVWTTQSGKRLLTAFTESHKPSMQELILFGTESDAKQNYYTFQHELGHIVVPNAGKPTNYAEHAADTFAVLRGFQSGFLDKKDAQLLAAGRDTLMWYNADYTHITSMSLDALVINPKQTDFISLTPGQTAKIAAKHAEAFSLSSDHTALAYMRQAVNIPVVWTSDLARLERLVNVAEVARRAPEYSAAFYTSVRAIMTAFDFFDAGNPVVREMGLDEPYWKQARDEICTRVKSRDVGAKAALAKNPDVAPDPEKSSGFFNKLRLRVKPFKI